MKNKLMYILLCAVTLAAMSAIILIPSESENNFSGETLGESSADYIYTVGEYSGMVAVYSYGSDKPLEILECPVDSLPEEDAKQLLNGIDVKTDEELQYLIEAYD